MAGKTPKKHTRKSLEEGIEAYFRSISRTVELTSAGGEPLLNDRGEVLRKREYLIPPSESALYLSLGIDQGGWEDLARQYPQVCAAAALRFQAYLEEQLLLRDKGLQGVIFDLENRWGWTSKGAREKEPEGGSTSESAPMDMEEKLRLIRAAWEAQAEDGVFISST